MCNSCLWGGITFPSFVGQSCCNPCCKSNGSVSGASNSTSRKCCFCFDCTACSGGTVSGSTPCSCGCKCSGNVVHRLRLFELRKRRRHVCRLRLLELRKRRRNVCRLRMQLRLPPLRKLIRSA